MTVFTPSPLPEGSNAQSTDTSAWGRLFSLLQWFVRFSQFYSEYNSRAPHERSKWLQQAYPTEAVR